MADVRETHLWWDGEHVHAYTERPADARKLTRILGEPDHRLAGAKGERVTWRWSRRPPNALSYSARRRVALSDEAKAVSAARLRKVQAERGRAKAGSASR